MIRGVLAGLSRRQRIAAAGLAVVLVFGALAETAIFLLIVPLAQTVASGDDVFAQEVGPLSIEASVATLVTVIFGAVLALTLARFIANFIQIRLVIQVERRARMRLFEDYVNASWEVQSQEPHGRIQSMSSFATARGDLLGLVMLSVRYVLNVSMMVGAAFVLAPLGALAILVVGGLMFAAFRPLVAAARRLSGEYVRRSTEHNEDLGELVAIGADLRVFDAGAGFQQRLARSNNRALRAKRRSGILNGSVVPTYQAIGLTLAVSILGYATTADVDLPVLGAIVILLVRSMSYGQALQGMTQKFAEYGPAVSALDEWHGRFSRARIQCGSEVLEQVHEIRFDSVGFSYGSDVPAVADVTLSMRQGEHFGLVGPSGSGKSTLVQLLLGLRAPGSGTILINGQPLLEYDETSRRRAMTLVPQRTNLFRGTVADNIRVFRDRITDDQVEDAARRAGLHETILTLPEGYRTEIGPAGRDLSGGQVQRIGIARALAGNPSLIVFDEPTSALDADSEALVTDTLRALPDDVTVVIVAHRMSTLRSCDRIAVLAAGRLEAVGTPNDVAGQSAFYQRAIAIGALEQPGG